jgi:phosphomannomutase / phosphoglucomutase
MRLFGTAGIRGVTNAEISPDLALRLGRACGHWLRERLRRAPKVALGHDTRYGASMLARAAACGFASAGCHVQNYGTIPTGAFSLNVAHTEQDGGLLVTGSHMPPDRIGLILVDAEGAVRPFRQTDEIEALLDAPLPAVPPSQIGRLEEAFHPYELYIAACMKALDAPLCRSKKFKAVVDPANGAACEIAKEFFEWLGCEVEMLHFDPNPLPDRPSEPRAATVGAAIDAVRRLHADFGACFDVDADRLLLIDADGRPLSEDVVGAIFAHRLLKPGQVCAVPVNSSGLIELVCGRLDVRLEYCEVGQPAEVEAIRTHKAAFCYEESGKYYFPAQGPWSDALFSAGRMLEIMAREGKSLARLAAEFPAFHQVKRNIEVADDAKTPAMLAVARRLQTELLEGRARDVTVDGLKRVYRDHAWLLFRKSGTEPLIRVYTDAPGAERARELADAGEKLLRECL